MHEPTQFNDFGTNPALGGAQATPAANSETRRGLREPPSVVDFPWGRERAMRLHKFCKTIERRRARGVTLRKAMEYFHWFWNKRAYRAAPQIKAHFGRATLLKAYYGWRRDGQSPDCFALHYADRQPPVTAEQLRCFLMACAEAGAVSMSQAARLAGIENGRPDRILARLPHSAVARIKAVFKERRQAELEARAAVKAFKRQMRRRRQAERRLGRGLEKLAAKHGLAKEDS